MKEAIKRASEIFLKKIEGKKIRLIGHYDTDGITSAAIMAKTLKVLDLQFAIKIIKGLEEDFIDSLKNTKEVLVFLDLGSASLEKLSTINTDVFVIDHHEISGSVPANVTFINPHIFDEEPISGAGMAYLFSKEILGKNPELANLALVGMVGDMLDKHISKWNSSIISDANVTIKKGLLLYPATRPINKTLEFSSSIYIPGVTGNYKGVQALLRDAGLAKEDGKYKSLIELTEEENSRLITEIILRTKKKGEELIGNIYLLKISNQQIDARELSAMINACSRLGHSSIALSLCLNDKQAKEKAENIYAEYKQHLIKALSFANSNKIMGKGYVLLNAKDEIKDTIIGTVASILSMSNVYEEGTIIIGMSYDNEKIKVSARIVGRNGRNLREVLLKATEQIGGELGGHANAAGCIIPKEKEQEFLENLIKNLEIEVVRL